MDEMTRLEILDARMTVPRTLMGHDVIEARRTRNREVWVVVVWRRGHEAHPFVVATWWEGLEGSWASGNYCWTLAEALREEQRILDMLL